MKLYELASDYLALMQMLENDEVEQETIADTLEAVQGEVEVKADNIACLLKNLDADILAIKAEEQRLAERRKVKENAYSRIKQYLAATLMQMGIDKVETARNKITFRRSESVEIAEGFIAWATANRDDLLTFKEPVPNKTEIKKALKAGAEIPGVAIVSGQNIQIK